MAPAAVAFIVAVVIPSVAILIRSLQANPLAGDGAAHAWSGNYAALLSQYVVRDALWRTLRVSLIATAVSIVLGTALVIAISVYTNREPGSWRVFVLIGPLLSGPIVTVLGWIGLFSGGQLGYRIVNFIRDLFGLEVGRVVETEVAMTIGLVHFLVPLVVLTLYPVARRVPPELLDASMTLGVSPIRTIGRVVIPHMKPAIVSATIVVLAMAVSAFVNAHFLGGERNLVLTTLVSQLVNTFQPTLAAAASVVLAAVGLGLLAIYARVALRDPS